MKNSLEKYGYIFCRGALDSAAREEITRDIEEGDGEMAFAGIRNPQTRFPAIQRLIQSSTLQSIAHRFLSTSAVPVRTLLFDKAAHADWGVPWHQDVTIAVQCKHTVPGFNAWSVKDGISHVRPPVEILERMVTLRLHLDDTDSDRGALHVIPGSHLHQRYNADAIAEARTQTPRVICEAHAGDILVMKPLLLHSSKKGISSGHRRILHIEYSADDLPSPLKWHY